MGHSISFFKDEVRNGFYIPTAIKQGWGAELDVLSVIDRICEEHDIKYFADWGTFLGAVRHGGFVPWDDDLDICMLRDDYEKFRSVADSLLPDGYVIHDYERKENHWLFLARVVNNSRMCFDVDYLDSHDNFPWLVGVDIFIKDYLYVDEEKEKKRDKEIMNILAVADGITSKELDSQSAAMHIDEIKRKYGVSFPAIDQKREVSVALYKLAERVMSEVKPHQAKSVGQIFPWVLKSGFGAAEKKEFYESIVRLPFEDTTIPVPAAYNRLLASRYGNYCEIRKVWTGHDYPFFEAQKREMEALSGETFQSFSFNASMLERKEIDKSRSLKETSMECLSALGSMLDEATAIIHGGMMEDLVQVISDSQQLAADFGTLVEDVKGVDRACTVSVTSALQEYCDALFQEYQEIAEGSDKDDLSLSRIALDNVSKCVTDSIIERKEVVFLPLSARDWKAFGETYTDVVSRDDTDVYVIPLPVMRKSVLGNITSSDGEIEASIGLEDYPKDIAYTDWKSYDMSVHCPDVVYIQNPYDGANPLLTVPLKFYARNMQAYAQKIVYMPIAKTSEFGEKDIVDLYNLKHYAAAPGVIYADEVIVQSKNIKNHYISALNALAGEDLTKIWDSKIHVTNPCDKEDTGRMKRILYCIGLNELAEKTDVLVESMTDKLGVFDEYEGKISVSIALYPDDRKQWDVVDRELAKEVFDKVMRQGYEVISMDASKADEEASCYDAYYGSPSPYVPAFVMQGKPVMLSDYLSRRPISD